MVLHSVSQVVHTVAPVSEVVDGIHETTERVGG